MPHKKDEFLKKLLATFRVEANEHLDAMSGALLDLEKNPSGERRLEIVEWIYREAHTLKGAARSVNFGEIESICHALENVFAGLKSNRVSASAPLFDILQGALGVLSDLLASGAAGPTEEARAAAAALVRQLDGVPGAAAPERVEALPALQETLTPIPAPIPAGFAPAGPEAIRETGAAAPVVSVGSETVRLATAKIDSVMRQTEELIGPRLAAGQRLRELREIGAALADWKKERAKVQPALRAIERSAAGRAGKNGAAAGIREIGRLLGYIEAENALLKTVENRLGNLEKAAQRDLRSLNAMVDGLLHDVKEMHMLPFSSLLDAFPRVVRELAREQGKQANLAIRGGDIEIDRRILEEMKNPFLHLMRNCIDHGLEKPPERERKGKPPLGTVTIDVWQQDSNKVEIRVADDGAGIDLARVKTAAGRIGLLAAGGAEELDEQEAIALIFRSGVSTNPIITDLSGRGLGLAIVRENVERLGGTIAVETRSGAGTSFRIVLPLTLATVRGVLVRAGNRPFIIPAVNVERAARVPRAEIRTVENRETISLGGKTVSLVSLSDVLEMPRRSAAEGPADQVPAVVLGLGPDRVAFLVDSVLGEQEVLVKGLGPQLARVRNVAGASALGTGEVVPVLNAADLMKSAARTAAPRFEPSAEKPAETARRSVLVVEDSITARALLKNILESAGYTVATAVDGMDALTTLKTGAFDLVVSDVEMPRMDGFDLTARVRSDKHLSELPIVLVTALESREQRERGIDVGANAYIVKSSFDQSNLLEVVARLI